ncbi:hypothetical protein KI387_003392, partial [Taxus chinensis]
VAQMEEVEKEAFVEHLEAMKTIEVEEVISLMELVIIVGLRNTISTNDLIYYSAL